MLSASGNRAERAGGRVGLTEVIVAPADDGGVGPEPTQMVPAAADSAEGSDEGVGLPGVVGVAPADDGGVGPEPTRLRPADGDSAESPAGRVGHPVSIGAPAGDGAVGSDSA